MSANEIKRTKQNDRASLKLHIRAAQILVPAQICDIKCCAVCSKDSTLAF